MSEDQKDLQTTPEAGAEAQSEKASPAEQPALAKPTEKASGDGSAAATAADASASSPGTKPVAAVKQEGAAPAGDTPAETPAAAQKPAAEKPAADKPAAAKAAPAGGAAKPAAAKKAPPPPDPRAVAAKEVADKIKAALTEKLGEQVVEETGAAHFNPLVLIRKADWAKAVDVLRTHPDWQLNYVELMAGTDYPNYIEVVIYVQSTQLKHFVCLKTRTERDKAEVPSLVPIFPGLNWEEREIYDLLGVTFTNHPDLRRIMMWDEFTGHPLRKDYSVWD